MATLLPNRRRLGRYAILARTEVGTWIGVDPQESTTLLEFRTSRSTRQDPQELVHRTQLSFEGVLEVHDVMWVGDEAWAVVEYLGGPRLSAFRAPSGRGAPPLEIVLALVSDLVALMDGDPRPLSLALFNPNTVRIDWQGRLHFDPQPPFPGVDAAPGVYSRRVGEFFSPEQVVGHALDERSDVFVLAIVLYNLVLRRSPFQVDGSDFTTLERIRAGEVAPFSIDGEVGNHLETLLNACLQRRPEDRLESPQVLKDRLDEIRRELPPITRDDTAAFLKALFADAFNEDLVLREEASIFDPDDFDALEELSELDAETGPDTTAPQVTNDSEDQNPSRVHSLWRGVRRAVGWT